MICTDTHTYIYGVKYTNPPKSEERPKQVKQNTSRLPQKSKSSLEYYLNDEKMPEELIK